MNIAPEDLKRRDAAISEARQLLDDNPNGLDAELQTRYDQLVEAAEAAIERGRRRAELQQRAEQGGERIFDGAPNVNMNRNPYQADGPETASDVRSRSLAAIETWKADGDIKEAATRTVERAEGDPGVAKHILAFSSPLYVKAFRRFAADPENFAGDLEPDERRAWTAAREHTRATLGTAGAVLPAPLDPTVILSNPSVVDSMRSVARIDQTSSLTKRYVTSAGSAFSFDQELAEVSDDTPSLNEVEISTEKAQGLLEVSIEAAMDQPDFASEAAQMIADAKVRLEAAAFINGAAGSNQPVGIITALTGGSSEVNAIGEDVIADDVYALLEQLPARWRARATWQLELSTLNALRRLYNPSGSEPPLIEGGQLLGRPYVENSELDAYSAIDSTATATHRPLIVGSWDQYVVLDRLGMTVQYLQPGILQGSSGRPDGRVGWYAYWRVGAGPLVTDAFRSLLVTTTE